MIPVTPRAHGPDISKYDLKFEPEFATHQLDFVIQRVSYRLTRDEAFDVLYPGVLRVPIRLAYHYHNSDRPWADQADLFLSIVNGKGYHAYAVDFERSFNTMSTKFAYDTYQFIKHVVLETGKPTFLYTNLNDYNNYIVPSSSQYDLNWNIVDYWQAQWPYFPDPINGAPSTPIGRTGGWKMWQYTAKANGTFYGLGRTSAGDLNVYNGTVEDLRRHLNITEPTPPVGPAYSFKVTGYKEVSGILEEE